MYAVADEIQISNWTINKFAVSPDSSIAHPAFMFNFKDIK